MDLPGSRRGRAWGMAVAVGLLMLVVGVTAAEVPGGDPSRPGLAFDSEAVADSVVPVIRFAYLMLLVAAVYQWLNRERAPRSRTAGKRTSPLAVFVALVLVAGFVVVVLPYLRSAREAAVTSTTSNVSPRPAPEDGQTVAVAPLGDLGAGVWPVVVIGVGAIAYLALVRRRGREVPAASEGAAEPPSIRRQPTHPSPRDPAARVIAAYRRVEVASARAGLGRSAAETVGTHLGRLGSVTEPTPAAQLASGFNQARYSARPVVSETADAAESDERSIVDRLGE